MSRKPRFDNYYFQNKERMRSVAKKRIELYKQQGLCINCGKETTSDFIRCESCRLKTHKYLMTKEARLQRKLQVFEKYGGCKCVCCGETHQLLLCMDHVNEDGAKHRKVMWKRPPKTKGGGNIYGWLVAKNYPEGFQVMCHSCNIGKHLNGGICPHNG